MSNELHSVTDIVDGLESLADKQTKISIGDVLDEFGNRSFAPIMLLLALLDLTPVGGIPGVPTVLAFSIALIACQLLIAREHIWVPQFIEHRSVAASGIDRGREKLQRLAQVLDKITQSRLNWFTHGIALKLAAALILVLCMTVPPLEFLPFASAAPMFAIAIISLALIVRDGVAILVGGAVSVATLGYGTWLLYTGEAGEMAEAATAQIASLAALW